MNTLTQITVPFHNADLYVIAYNGQPYTPMKPIVENMGLAWQSQLAKFNSNAQKWGITKIVIPTIGDLQEMVCLPLRKLFGWLMTISPNKVKPEIRNTVIKYQEECDDVLWDYWTKGVAVKPTFDMAETLSKTINQLSNGNKKLYMSMYNGLTRRFKVGRLSDIPIADINKAIATAYTLALEWHNKNNHTTLKLNDGQHYIIAKDGVALYQKVLSTDCSNITPQILGNQTLLLEHIRQVVGEFVGKDALPASKPTLDINYPAITARPRNSFSPNQHWYKANDFVDGSFDPVRDFLEKLEQAGYEVTGLQIINQAKTWIIRQQDKAIKQIDKGYKHIADGLRLNNDFGMNVYGFTTGKVSL